ncbi:MAG: hypothetical protein EOP56_18105 [Sphingobacteriales bacterium]|nr:MAG: hypothetical protein EOP56_18105 [Sphingobacteriales bacterium]
MNNQVIYELSLRDVNFSSGIRKADSETNKLEASVMDLKSSMSSIKGLAVQAFAGWGIREVGRDIVDVMRRMDRLRSSLNFNEGGKGAGAARLEYLKDLSYDLGLELESSAKGYTTIAAAARGTKLEGQGVIDIFEGVSTAATVLQLSSDETVGALLAISQMMSKGKVQAEELRGQLGERIPGAFQIAARAMGMTTKQLDKFMSDGKLVSEDFLPRFAAQLKQEFAEGIPEATRTMGAEFNRLGTDTLFLKDSLGEELRPEILETIGALREGVGWMRDNSDTVVKWGKLIGKVAVAYYGFRTAIYAVRGAQTIWAGLMGQEIGTTITATGVTGRYTLTVDALTAAVERLNAANLRATESTYTLYNAQGQAISRGIVNPAGAGPTPAPGTPPAGGTALVGAGKVIGYAAAGVLLYEVGSTIKRIFEEKDWFGDKFRERAESSWKDNLREQALNVPGGYAYEEYLKKYGSLYSDMHNINRVPIPYSRAYALGNPGLLLSGHGFNIGKTSGTGGTGGGGGLGTDVDKVKGQSIKNIYININKEMIGEVNVNAPTGTAGVPQFMQELKTALTGVLNDSQIISDAQ